MELLIRTVDKHPVVAAICEEASCRGDVICAMPDGWAWSPAERSNPEWMIVKTDITQIEADALLAVPLAGEGKWRRRFGLRLDGFTGDTMNRAEINERVYF